MCANVGRVSTGTAIILSAGLASLGVIRPKPVQAAGLLIADNGFGGVLKVEEQDVKVTVNNGVCVTEVEQVFRNTENRVVEALYTFPVPNEASVSNFSMWINGTEMVGEVVEKERARMIYDSYKQKRRDPGLLEQVDYKRFEMRIYPIPAGAAQRVKITYAQELDYDHDTATYVFPLATNSGPQTGERTTGRFAFSLEAKSEVAITEMKSPSHAEEFVVGKHSENYWQASLEAREGDLNRDVVIVYRLQRPRTGLDLITSKQGREDGYFLLTLTAGPELESAAQGSDYVFVLDVSGSMAHDGKLGLSRGSIQEFMEALQETDRAELLTFNITQQALFGTLQPANAETKARAEEFLKAQRAAGGTSLMPAVEAAYRYRQADRPLNVVVLSDGMTEQQESAQLMQLIARRPAGVTVFCVGIGNEVNRPLLTQIAHDAGGLASFISTEDDFARQAEAFRRKVVRPAASNVRITFSGGDVYDMEPLTLPNLYYGQPIRLYGRYRASGQTKVNIKAEILGSPLDQTVEVELPAEDDSNPQIERMWAFHRVQRLMEDGRRAGSDFHRNEVVRLCEGYSIVSEYASFLVLENDAEYQRWQIERRNATRMNRDRAAQLALRNQLDGLRRQPGFEREPANVVMTARPAAESTPRAPELASQIPTTPSFEGASPANSDNSRGWDIPLPNRGGGGGGGGAIDPLTLIFGVGLAGWGLANRFGKRQRKGSPV